MVSWCPGWCCVWRRQRLLGGCWNIYEHHKASCYPDHNRFKCHWNHWRKTWSPLTQDTSCGEPKFSCSFLSKELSIKNEHVFVGKKKKRINKNETDGLEPLTKACSITKSSGGEDQPPPWVCRETLPCLGIFSWNSPNCVQCLYLLNLIMYFNLPSDGSFIGEYSKSSSSDGFSGGS